MVLKVLLCVFILVLLSRRDNGLNDADWYREAMTTGVVSRYNRAYKILNEDIIKPILEFDDKSSNGSNFDTLFRDEQTINEGDDNNKIKEDESSETKDTIEIVNGNTTLIDDDESKKDEYTTNGKEDEFSETKDTIEIFNGNTTLIDDDESKKDEYTTEGQEDEPSATMVKRSVDDDDDDELDSNEFKFVNDEELITTTEYASTVEVTESTPITDDVEMNVSSTVQTHEEDVRLADLVKKLRHGSNMVHELLKAASSGCEQMRTDLSTRIRVAAISISTQEAELHRLQSEIQGLVSAVHSAEEQAAFAEKVVREREATVENSERELREAEDQVEKARRCQRRRRRRFIGGWVKKHVQRPIGKVVQAGVANWQRHVERPVVHVVNEGIVKPVCSVVNMDGINRAKDARNTAKEGLNAARNRLSTQQQVLSNKRAQLSNVQIQQNAANERQRMLRLILTQMQTNFETIASLLEQFQVVNTHLTTVLGSSKTLRDEIKNLVDFELVIEPLKSLAEKMIKDQLMTSFNFEISARTIADVDRILDRLGDKLARFPLFIQNSNVSDDATD
jgi:hypothetical protein